MKHLRYVCEGVVEGGGCVWVCMSGEICVTFVRELTTQGC